MKAGRYMIFVTATLVRLRAELSIITNNGKMKLESINIKIKTAKILSKSVCYW